MRAIGGQNTANYFRGFLDIKWRQNGNRKLYVNSFAALYVHWYAHKKCAAFFAKACTVRSFARHFECNFFENYMVLSSKLNANQNRSYLIMFYCYMLYTYLTISGFVNNFLVRDVFCRTTKCVLDLIYSLLLFFFTCSITGCGLYVCMCFCCCFLLFHFKIEKIINTIWAQPPYTHTHYISKMVLVCIWYLMSYKHIWWYVHRYLRIHIYVVYVLMYICYVYIVNW